MRTEFVARIKFHAKSICIFGIILSLLPSLHAITELIKACIKNAGESSGFDWKIFSNKLFNSDWWIGFAKDFVITVVLCGICTYIATVSVLAMARAVENSEAKMIKKFSKKNGD